MEELRLRACQSSCREAAHDKPCGTSARHPRACRLLTKDPRKRPDAREALGHPWLKVTSSKSEQGDAYMQAISNEVAQNLSVFAASNKLQRAFMHLAVGFLHKNEMEKMLAMFNTLNTDRTTPLPAAEIKEMLCRGRRHEDQDAILKTVDVRLAPRAARVGIEPCGRTLLIGHVACRWSWARTAISASTTSSWRA